MGSPVNVRVSILLSNNLAVITWPAAPSGFELRENNNLSTTNWVRVNATPIVVGNEKRVELVLPQGAAQSFYRLTCGGQCWP